MDCERTEFSHFFRESYSPPPPGSLYNTPSGDYSHPDPCITYYYDREPEKDYEGGQHTGAATQDTVGNMTYHTVGLTPTCSWLLRSKRGGRRLPLPALHILIVPLPSHRTLRLIRNIIKADLVTSD